MKKRLSNFIAWVIGAFIFWFILVIISAFLIPDNKIRAIFILIICALIFVPIFIVKGKQLIKFDKEYKQKYLEKTKQTLTSEYQTVSLRYINTIPMEKVTSQAKVDSDGKIVCRIQVDFELIFNSYVDFCNRFSLEDE